MLRRGRRSPNAVGFTSLYGLVQAVGNFLGLPISIGGLLLGGGSSQVPGVITKFTQAAQLAIQQFPASVAATLQAILTCQCRTRPTPAAAPPGTAH